MRRGTSLSLALLGGGVAFAGMATELGSHARQGDCQVQRQQDPTKPCAPSTGSGGSGGHGSFWHGSSTASTGTASFSARGGFGASAGAHGGGE
jgi:hypothetical protein